jgi:hypothetical protein
VGQWECGFCSAGQQDKVTRTRGCQMAKERCLTESSRQSWYGLRKYGVVELCQQQHYSSDKNIIRSDHWSSPEHQTFPVQGKVKSFLVFLFGLCTRHQTSDFSRPNHHHWIIGLPYFFLLPPKLALDKEHTKQPATYNYKERTQKYWEMIRQTSS